MIKTSFFPLQVFSKSCSFAAGTLFHLVRRTLVRSVGDVGRLGLTHKHHCNSSQRPLMGSKSRLESSYSTQLLTNSRNTSVMKWEMGFPKLLTQKRAEPCKIVPQCYRHQYNGISKNINKKSLLGLEIYSF